MKGKKAYFLSQAVNKRLYSEYTTLTEIDKNKLYNDYFLLLKRAAYSGHLEAVYDFAQQFDTMNFLGIKNPLYNPEKCIFWYSKACDKGHLEAYNNLAGFYEKGEGCEKNLIRALELYESAAKSGSFNGKKNYKIMLKDLAKGGKYNK